MVKEDIDDLINSYESTIEQELLQNAILYTQASETLNKLCETLDESQKEFYSIVDISKQIILLSSKK